MVEHKLETELGYRAGDMVGVFLQFGFVFDWKVSFRQGRLWKFQIRLQASEELLEWLFGEVVNGQLLEGGPNWFWEFGRDVQGGFLF
jgi:hypothetical protein